MNRPIHISRYARVAQGATLALQLLSMGAGSQAQTITLFDVPSPAGGPMGIAPGFGDDVWFTTIYSWPVDKICRITTSGSITCFDLPWICDGGALSGCYPYSIVAAPDGNLWFGQLHGALARSTPSGQMQDRWDFTVARGANQVIVGRDGALWGTLPGGGLFRVETDTGDQRSFATPTQPSIPAGLTMTPDGEVWFSEQEGRQVGRLNPTTGEITEYRLPYVYASPQGVAFGPDGNVWYAERGDGRVGRISAAGLIAEYQVAQRVDVLSGICAGPDGNLWVTGRQATSLWRVTPSGGVTGFPLPGGLRGGSQITTGPDGNLWFTMTNAHKIGRVDMAAVAALPAIPALSPPALAALALAIALAAIRLLRR